MSTFLYTPRTPDRAPPLAGPGRLGPARGRGLRRLRRRRRPAGQRLLDPRYRVAARHRHVGAALPAGVRARPARSSSRRRPGRSPTSRRRSRRRSRPSARCSTSRQRRRPVRQWRGRHHLAGQAERPVVRSSSTSASTDLPPDGDHRRRGGGQAAARGEVHRHARRRDVPAARRSASASPRSSASCWRSRCWRSRSRSLLAAGLPLLTAALGVAITLAGVLTVAQLRDDLVDDAHAGADDRAGGRASTTACSSSPGTADSWPRGSACTSRSPRPRPPPVRRSSSPGRR